MWPFLAVLAVCLIFLSGSSIWAWMPRKPLLYGIGERPDTAPATYSLARAEAWLKAVNLAEAQLSRDVDGRLRQLGLPLREGRRAVAALMYPLDVVTPEHVGGDQVRVFLRDDADSGQVRPVQAQILAEPWRLLLEMCILREMDMAVYAMRSPRPGSEASSVDSEPAFLLRQLWHAASLNAIGSKGDGGEWDDLTATDDSVAVALLQASRATSSSRKFADEAVALCMDREVSDPDAVLWSILAAYGSYLRARGHERLGQPALAEADLDTAINRIRESGMMPGLEVDAVLARAGLRRKRGNTPGMCEDYYDACGLGRCRQLAQVRREGLCSP